MDQHDFLGGLSFVTVLRPTARSTPDRGPGGEAQWPDGGSTACVLRDLVFGILPLPFDVF